jgi:hypothetical protein
MRAASSKARTFHHPEEPLTDLQYFCQAIDLLQQLITELQFLTTQNPALAYTMFDGESAAFLHMRTLLETIDALLGVDDLSMAIPPRRRAAVLISWLSNEIEKLMLYAAWGEAPVDPYDMVMH